MGGSGRLPAVLTEFVWGLGLFVWLDGISWALGVLRDAGRKTAESESLFCKMNMNEVERLIDMTIPRVGRGLFVDIAYFSFSFRGSFFLVWKERGLVWGSAESW